MKVLQVKIAKQTVMKHQGRRVSFIFAVSHIECHFTAGCRYLRSTIVDKLGLRYLQSFPSLYKFALGIIKMNKLRKNNTN